MLSSRRLAAGLLLIGLLALSVPAVSFAGGGGSAGDQQYTDPFAGTTTPTSATQTATLTATTPQPTTSATAAAPPPASTTTAAGDGPVATTASTSSQPAQLAFTGYDGWLAAAIGAALVTAGMTLRHRLRRS